MSRENLTRDLHAILSSYLDLIGCDGGSIYALEKNDQDIPVLVFKAMITRSKGISHVPEDLKNLKFALDETTLVGRTGKNQKFYKATYEPHHSSVDPLLNYGTESVLSAPLITPRGSLVGVVQLVNKIDDGETDFVGGKPHFTQKDERLVAIVSSQAALTIENSMLLHEQEQILDGFVNACVTAIEARDPVTAGHSQRVCDLSLNLAEGVNRVQTGELSSVSFSVNQLREIRYAALLHDIGKISVREEVLLKEKKLYPWELEKIEMRFKMMRMALKSELHGPQNEFELARKLKELEKALHVIHAANEPTVLPQDVSKGIIDLTKIHVHLDDGEVCCALHEHEKEKLCIPRGSLSKEERVEIEKHVSFTYEILRMVPWGRGLDSVPLIAHRHHEKLDGTGYPMGVPAIEIPVQSRILTICDIFDALTAADRPYKAAVPIDKALDILHDEVKRGKLDGTLYQLFVDSKAYDVPAPITIRAKKVA